MAFADKKMESEYINGFMKDNYDRFALIRPKGDKAKIKKLAQDRGVSVNELINWCIDQQLKSLGYDIQARTRTVRYVRQK